ncbi:hypothetical protein ACJX0J_023461, partial [Zea mays]
RKQLMGNIAFTSLHGIVAIPKVPLLRGDNMNTGNTKNSISDKGLTNVYEEGHLYGIYVLCFEYQEFLIIFSCRLTL